MIGFNKSLNIFFLALIFLSSNLCAQNVLPDSVVHERIESIRSMLDHSKPGMNGWWYGWLATYSVATVGQGAAYFLNNDKSTKQDMALGSTIALIGAVGQALTPLNSAQFRIIDQLPENTTEEKLYKLAVVEELFKKTAMTEKLGRSWQVHALNEAVNLGSGLITWLAFKRSVWDGVSNFVLNSVVTEVQIWTQPTRAMKDYQKYCRKYKTGQSPLANKIEPEYFVKVYPGSVGLSIVF